MKSMKAYDFKISKGKVEFVCEFDTKDGNNRSDIYFELENEIIPSNDAIALAVSTFAGTNYQELSIELEISKKTKENISNFTKANVIAPVGETEFLFEKRNSMILNFSGGFDSLAALSLMPSDTKLVAVDFGGWFDREREFFEKFKPYTLKTNFRQLGLDKNSWTFMGVGAVLYAEALNAGYNVFGTILEATPMQFYREPVAAKSTDTHPFFDAGLKDVRYTNGLTEVGTAMVVSYYNPELAEESLKSLSSPKTEKRYRKEMLLDIVCEKYQRAVSFEKTEAPDRKVPFGKNFAVDFLCLYILKNRGMEAANGTVCDIPQEAVEFVEKHQLNFYERLNCEFVSGSTFPNNKARAEFMGKVSAAGILPYTENDYQEFRETAEFLNKYYCFWETPKETSKIKRKKFFDFFNSNK